MKNRPVTNAVATAASPGGLATLKEPTAYESSAGAIDVPAAMRAIAATTSCADIRDMGNGVILVRFKPDTSLDAPQAVELVEVMLRRWGQVLHGNLLDLSNVKYVSQDARYEFGRQHSPNVSGVALLIDSALHQAMGNLYLSVARPRIPTRLFTREPEAVAWLLQQNSNRRSGVHATAALNLKPR